jgi:hypothetical protein
MNFMMLNVLCVMEILEAGGKGYPKLSWWKSIESL